MLSNLKKEKITLRRNNNSNYNRDHKMVDGLSVEVKNGDFNKALRRFKKKVADDGILQTLREKQYYEKPSEKRKKAKAAGRARWLKKVKKRLEDHGY